MPKTAVALFKNPTVAQGVVAEIERLGIPKKETVTLEEPGMFPVNGVMNFNRLDYEVELGLALTQIGASSAQQEAYVKGLRNGGALVLASGPDQKMEAAIEIMNRQGAVSLEESDHPEPALPEPDLDDITTDRDAPVQAGRIRETSSGAQLFVW